MLNWKVVTLIFLLFTLSFFGVTYYRRDYPASYWLWAGITQGDAPAGSDLYIYQGLISGKDSRTHYKRLGLYPHPIKGKKLYLVYRLEGDLSNATDVVDIFEKTVASWRRHKIKIHGLQLDFDSPTSKLLIYSDFLEQVRSGLSKNYALSITGLGEWAIYGDREAMSSIAKSVDEIVFQLYQGRKSLKGIDAYVKSLKKYPFPFKIGLLLSEEHENYIANLRDNTRFKGTIYFIQKGKSL